MDVIGGGHVIEKRFFLIAPGTLEDTSQEQGCADKVTSTLGWVHYSEKKINFSSADQGQNLSERRQHSGLAFFQG